jgi:hypothetical protein
MVQVSSQKFWGCFIFLLSHFVNSQIWLNCLMEDCQFPLKFDFDFYWVFIDGNTQMSIIPALQVLTLWNRLGAPLLIEGF